MDRLPVLTAKQRTVFSVIYSNPGEYIAALCRLLNMDRGNFEDTLLRLERLGLVLTCKEPIPTTHRIYAPERRAVYPAPWTLR